MTSPHSSRHNSDQVFVEIIGPDGLAHHVGPFKTNAQAQEWIELNSSDKTCPQGSADKKVTAAGGTTALLKPAD